MFVLNFLFEISCEPGEYSNRNSEDVLAIKILIVVVTLCISSQKLALFVLNSGLEVKSVLIDIFDRSK